MSFKDVKLLVKRMGGVVRSVNDWHGRFEVVGVNGRKLVFEMEGDLLWWKAYDCGGEEIRLLKRDVLTSEAGWRMEVEGVLKYVMVAELLLVSDSIIR